MRTIALIHGFGRPTTSLTVASLTALSLTAVSMSAAAEPSRPGAAASPQARIGSLAPDEARRAERARRRAATKNAEAAARDTKVGEGKSVAVPGDVPGSTVKPAAAAVAPAREAAKAPSTSTSPAPAAASAPPQVKAAQVKAAQVKAAPVKAATAAAAVPARNNVASRPAQATDGARVKDAGSRTADRARSGDREARVRRAGPYAARRKTYPERFAADGRGDRRFMPRGTIVAEDPQDVGPRGMPPYAMAPRFREVYVVRVAPPPPAFWGDGPRRFYPAPGFMRQPMDDVD